LRFFHFSLDKGVHLKQITSHNEVATDGVASMIRNGHFCAFINYLIHQHLKSSNTLL